MFNFSFYEMMVFGIIALIVLGPEKLPQAVRTVGTYYSKFRRTIGTLKAEMEAELDLAETRQLMEQELAKIRQSEAQMQKEMAQLRGSIQEFEQQQNSALKKQLSGKSDTTTTDTTSLSSHNSAKSKEANLDRPLVNDDAEVETDAAPNSGHITHQYVPPMTRPWENMWFLLGDYDRVRRLPPAPYLPNYTANPLLYNSGAGSAKPTEI